MGHLLTEDLQRYHQPDDPGGASVASADSASTDTPAAPAAQPESSTTTATAPTSTPAAQPTGASPTPAAAPSSLSWLERVRKEAGFDPGADDNAAVANIKRLYEERAALESLRSLAPHVSSYVKDAVAFNKWREEQDKAQQAKVESDRKANWYDKFYSPPEYNPSWERYIAVDPATGKQSWLPDTPLDVQQKYQQHRQYQDNEIQKFRTNPAQYIAALIDERVPQLSQEQLKTHLATADERAKANAFVQQHSNWLYEQQQNEKGEIGGPKMQAVIDPQTGQMRSTPVLSHWGKLYQGYAEEGHRLGLNMDNVMKFAMTSLQRDVLEWRLNQSQSTTPPAASPAEAPKTPQQKKNDDFLNRNNPPAPARREKTGNSVPAKPAVTARNLEEVMRKRLAELGNPSI